MSPMPELLDLLISDVTLLTADAAQPTLVDTTILLLAPPGPRCPASEGRLSSEGLGGTLGLDGCGLEHQTTAT